MMILIGIPYAMFVLLIIVLTLLSLYRGKRKMRTSFGNGLMLFSEIVFTIIGPIIGFFRFDAFQPEIPFAKQHVLIIMLLTFVSVIAFWIARLTQKYTHPLVKIATSVGILQGILLCIVVSIHFIPFYPLGLIFPFFGFELLAPPVALFLLVREFYFNNELEMILPESLPYREELGLIPLPVKIMRLSFGQRIGIYLLLLLFLLGIEIALSLPLGQQMDSIIKAFTHSVGFVFSKNF